MAPVLPKGTQALYLGKLRSYAEETSSFESVQAYARLTDVLNLRAETTAQDYADDLFEAFPPEVLFGRELMADQGRSFYVLFRDILDTLGVTVKRGRGILVTKQIADALYDPNPTESDEPPSAAVAAECASRRDGARALINANHLAPVAVGRGSSRSADQRLQGMTAAIDASPAAEEGKPAVRADQGPVVATSTMYTQEQVDEAVRLRNSRVGADMDRGSRNEDESVVPASEEGYGSNAKRKSHFVQALHRRYGQEDAHPLRFQGIGPRSWTCHQEDYQQLAGSYDIQQEQDLLKLIVWTFGIGPRLTHSKYMLTDEPTFAGFLQMMDAKHNTALVQDQARATLRDMSLQRIIQDDTEEVSTRHYRAISSLVINLEKNVHELPNEERTDMTMLSYLRSAIKGVQFAMIPHQESIKLGKGAEFTLLSTSLQSAARLQDEYGQSTGASAGILHANVHTIDDDYDMYNVFFTDRRLGRSRRSPKCGAGKGKNGSDRHGDVLKCHDCKSDTHLKYFRDCSFEKERRKSGVGLMDGVRKQLKDGIPAAEVLAYLVIACDGQDDGEWTPDDEGGETGVHHVDYEPSTFRSEQQLGGDDDETLHDTNFASRVAHLVTTELTPESESHFVPGHSH